MHRNEWGSEWDREEKSRLRKAEQRRVEKVELVSAVTAGYLTLSRVVMHPPLSLHYHSHHHLSHLHSHCPLSSGVTTLCSHYDSCPLNCHQHHYSYHHYCLQVQVIISLIFFGVHSPPVFCETVVGDSGR